MFGCVDKQYPHNKSLFVWEEKKKLIQDFEIQNTNLEQTRIRYLIVVNNDRQTC